MKKNTLNYIILLYLIFICNYTFASPWIEKRENYQINWTSQKISFNSRSGAKLNRPSSLPVPPTSNKNLEKISSGENSKNFPIQVDDAKQSVKLTFYNLISTVQKQDLAMHALGESVKPEPMSSPENLSNTDFSKVLYTKDTTYFSSGEVEITRESSLENCLCYNNITPKISPLSIEGDSHETNTQDSGAVSGIIFVGTELKPTSLVKLVTEKGVTLATLGCKKSSSPKVLPSQMPKWAKGTQYKEFSSIIGSSPSVVNVVSSQKGLLTVQTSDLQKMGSRWEDFLKNGKYLIVNK